MAKKFVYSARTDKDHVFYHVIEANGKAEAIKLAKQYCKENNLKFDIGSLTIEK